ncbi:MAG TPA: phospholipase C, phosphocholine-specific [Panacibacter sp.]|nr:phospholipase C, phosphocholine-specific [Panacibacter sp.]
MDSRRDFIKKAGLLSGAAGLLNMLPPAVQKAMAIDPAPGTTWQDAEHVVLLMQENRSFDHCFGSLQGVRGFNDPRAITLPNKNKVWLQSNAKGETYAPFRLNMKDTKATWMSSLPHSWANQTDARNDGKYDKWLDAKQAGEPYQDIPMTMGYYTREDIPFYYAMADAFTVCDQHFCSSLTGTTPNRLFFFTGTIREDEHSKARVRNSDTDYDMQAAWKTFPEWLEENSISWKIYQNELSVGVGFEGEEDAWLSNFTDNPIEWFEQYNVKLSKGYLGFLATAPARIAASLEKKYAVMQTLTDAGKITALKQEIKELETWQQQINKDKEIYTVAKYRKLSNHEKNLHDKAFATNSKDPHFHELSKITYIHNGAEETIAVPRGDILHQFRDDVKTGKLPTVSWIVAPENFSDHPTSPWYGAWYISEVMDILTQNPEVWKKTIFIVTYDENDGCFDHVPPFIPPNPYKENTGLTTAGIDTKIEYVRMEDELKEHNNEEARAGAIGLGYRVPLIIASPWSRGGWVCSEVFDHTSSLQFLEKFIQGKTGNLAGEKNISTWRRTVCGDLTSVFRPYNGEQIKAPAFPAKDQFIKTVYGSKYKGVPDNYKKLSAQEIQQINENAASSPYMPQQEKGIRSSCALPYELYADGQVSNDKQQFIISFNAADTQFKTQAAGAAFHVYDYSKEVNSRAYTVAAGNKLKDSWQLTGNAYHLELYGPNGFYRMFTGTAQDPPLLVYCMYETDGNALTGNILAAFNNTGNAPCSIELTDNAYKSEKQIKNIAANQQDTLYIPLGKSFGWYDFTITIQGHTSFQKRYAGRVETGKHSFTDPYMGQVV